MNGFKVKVKSKLYYDRRSAGQSVLEQSTHLGLTTRSWLLSDSCGFVGLGRPLWREERSVVCNCYWSSPAQSFSGPSSVGFVAIFYCFRFETSLFVASYDSQGHGGGNRPRLHNTGYERIHEWTLFYNFERIEQKPLHRTIRVLVSCIRCSGNAWWFQDSIPVETLLVNSWYPRKPLLNLCWHENAF
jgi:hypothetical protein